MKLYIGNKNYSSWSLRSWLLMKHAGIAFEEVRLRLDFAEGSEFRITLAPITPGGKVPVLVDDGFAVWDTLAIAEYLAEQRPDLHLWPQDRLARARARSICAEMHSGFAALRQHCPMNVEAELAGAADALLTAVPALQADLKRLAQMWSELLEEHGGPFLFGTFSIADAYYAPVCSRIKTYALPVAETVGAYASRILALPAMQTWTREACAEHEFLPEDEPFRQQA